MFRVIIAGGRNFNDYALLKKKCDHYLSIQINKNINVEIVSGAAKGADKLGERYAKERGFKLTQFPADWDKLGKKAGYIRNDQMRQYSDALICFWDGESKGSQHMISTAKKDGLLTRVVKYKEV